MTKVTSVSPKIIKNSKCFEENGIFIASQGGKN